jgi:predicted tellurium resistance membrane protein TerC
MLYKPPISHKKILYYLFYILGWLGVIIGVLDLFVAFAQKHFSFYTFTGFLWALLFFIFAALAKKKKKKKEITNS